MRAESSGERAEPLSNRSVSTALLRTIATSIREPLLALDAHRRILLANSSFYETFGYEAGRIEGEPLFDLGRGRWDNPRLRLLLDEELPEKGHVENVPLVLDPETEESVHLRVNGCLLNDGRLTLLSVERRESKDGESLHFLTQLLEATRNAVMAADMDGRVTYWNRSAELLYGRSTEEAVGRSLREVMIPHLGARQTAAIMARLQSGEHWSGELEVQRHDGSSFSAAVTDVPLRDTNGELTALARIATDVTERRQDDQALHSIAGHHRALLAGIPGVILRMSRQGECLDVYVSDAKPHLFPDVDLLGSNVADVLEPLLAGRWLRSIEASIEEGETQNLSYTVSVEEGRSRHYEASISALDEDEVLVVARDVTARQEAEDELRRRNRELEVLLNVSRQLTRRLDLDALLHQIVRCVVETLSGAEAASLWLVDERSGDLVLRANEGHNDETLRDLQVLADDGLVSSLLHHDQPQTFRGEALRGAGRARVMLGVPLQLEGKAVGILLATNFSESRHAFDPRDGRLLQSLAAHAAIAIQEAQLVRQLQAVPVQLLQAQEAERQRIARELHDAAGSTLTSLHLTLSMSQRALPASNEPAAGELRRARQLVHDLTRQIRDLSLELRPRSLDELGLVAALRSYVKRYTQQTGIQVRFHHELESRQRFDPLVETTAFRIVQEALTNVARYAGVHHVQVMLLRDENELVLHVIDEGVGFDHESVQHAGETFGLSGMRERAVLLGGTFQVATRPGEGTRITAFLPLESSVTSPNRTRPPTSS